MADDSIGLLREQRNESGHGKPKQSLNEEKHESPKTQLLDIAFYVHFIFPKLRVGKIDEKRETDKPKDCSLRMPILDLLSLVDLR